jgi:hypothetical protein
MALSSPFALTAKPLMIMARRGKWFPVAVTLSNTGDPVTGTLRLKLVAGGEFENAPNESYCPVELPTNSNKVVWLYGRMERPNVAGVDITFSGRGFTSITQRVPIQEPYEGQRVILTVSDNVTGLTDTLKGLRGSGLSLTGAADPTGFNPSGSQGPLRPLETSRSGVPDRWIGLESADMVVLGDFPHTGLAPPQIDALRGFVVGGGNMLALGGANAARLSSSPLADLWPGVITTSNTASPAEVAGIVRQFVDTPRNGADRLGGAPVVVTRATLGPNSQLRMGTQASPLFSMLDTGAGRVLFLGFDPSQPPFNGWSGQDALWRDIFRVNVATKRFDGVDGDYFGFNPSQNYGNGYNPGYNPSYNSGYNQNYQQAPSTSTGVLLNALAKAPQLSMPPVSQIAWFLSLYVFVLVPLNYAVLRFVDRRELAWITIPVIVAAFSAFAYASALSIRGNAILTRQVDVVQTSLGSKTARTDSLLWLFSPKRTTYDISSSSSDAAIADFANDAGGKQGAFSILQPADASSFKIEGANVWMWTDRGFVSQSIADLKNGITVQGGKVQNGTPLELQGVVWVQDHEVRSLGTIKTGGSTAIPVNATSKVASVELLGAITSASNVDSIFNAKTVSNGIPNSALSAALGANYGLQNEGPVLVAWVKKSVVPLSIGMGGANASDLSLLVVRVPPTAASRIALREAIVKHVSSEMAQPSRNMGASTDSYEASLPPAKSWTLSARGTGANSLLIPASPMPGGTMPGLPVPGSGMTVSPPVNSYPNGSAPTKIHFEAWNDAQKRWIELSGQLTRDNSTSGGWDFQSRIPGNLPRQPDRFLRLRIRRDGMRARVSNVRISSE